MNTSVPKCNQAGMEFVISVEKNLREKALYLSEDFPLSMYTQHYCDAASDQIPLHWHNELQMVWIAEGRLSYCVNEETFLLDSGKLLLITDHQLHSSRTTEQDTQTLCLNFSTDIFHPVIQEKCILPFFKDRPFPYILLPVNSQHIQILENLLSARGEALEYMSVISFIYQIFEEILKDYDEKTKSEDYGEVELFQNILDFIHTHYAEPLTVTQIAGQALINKNRLNTLFNKYTHLSTIKYLNQYRLYNAKNLIIYTDKPISEISEEVGYNQLSHFIQQFRESYGLAPLKYRNKYSRTNQAASDSSCLSDNPTP